MSYKFIFVFLMIGHFLGDYYLQPQKLADAKGKRRGALLLHCLIYGAALAALCLPLISFPQAWWILFIPLSHAGIDYLKNALLKAKCLADGKRGRLVFFADQGAHLIIMGVFALLFTRYAGSGLSAFCQWLFLRFEALGIGVTGTQLIKMTALLLFLGKPCNMIVRNIMPPREQPEEALLKKEQKAGRAIGILERLLTAFFILVGQWGALGFALAAKTLTRFNKISEDRDFAEQYLIGTMASVLLTVVAVLIYKQL
ncbi:MAG: DUF3307 domain-containing protein [Clostridiales bacterium]|nr:DUF3307 domain-containing protein [Clostridiales bacterium]